jgi:hypothetical protein
MYNVKMRRVYVTMDWIDLAQNRDRWRALVNAVMNIPVQKNALDFWTS